jgi:hypothetical protein
MAYFKRNKFSGTAPGVAPRLLSDEFGQIAKDCDLSSGRLVGIHYNTDVFTLASANKQSIYHYEYGSSGAVWLQWDEEVSVAKGPIPGDLDDRLYWTGQGYPRIGNSTTIVSGTSYPGNSWRLGVPAPPNAPVVTTDSSEAPDDTLTPFDVSYVFTLVTADGREGPPSDPSGNLEIRDEQPVTLDLSVPTYSLEHNLNSGARKRIYRSNTGSTNTQFQFVGEVQINVDSFTDATESAALGEVIPTTDWIGPPDDDATLYPDGPMQDLIPLSNGVMAGFTGKRFCVSEPFMPHAWPISYRITTEEDIVGIASTGNGVAALTKGRPYFITGTEPSAMTAITIDLAQGCINKNSIVDMGEYILYAGPDGLCMINGASGEVVTNGLISPDQWRANYYPHVYKAFIYEGTYVALWNGGGFVMDPKGGGNALTTLTGFGSGVGGGFHDIDDGELYLIVDNVIKKYRSAAAQRTAFFKSKIFTTPKPVSMQWVSVNANDYPVRVRVWGDGTLIANYQITRSGGAYTQVTDIPANISNGTLREPLMRMPAVVAQEWEVQVEGTDINEFCLAQSIEEIQNS